MISLGIFSSLESNQVNLKAVKRIIDNIIKFCKDSNRQFVEGEKTFRVPSFFHLAMYVCSRHLADWEKKELHQAIVEARPKIIPQQLVDIATKQLQ